jgi:hypothetical protein
LLLLLLLLGRRVLCSLRGELCEGLAGGLSDSYGGLLLLRGLLLLP